MKSKKAQVFDQLAGLGIGIAALVITLVVIFLIISQSQTQLKTIESRPNMVAANGTTGYNATVTLQAAVATIPGWVPLIVIAVIGSILLGLVALFRR